VLLECGNLRALHELGTFDGTQDGNIYFGLYLLILSFEIEERYQGV
jgi:hypothetical protein